MTPRIIPASRPDISPADAISLAGDFYDPSLKYWLLGRRGYYRDSMGLVNKNDRGLYDDAIALVTPERVVSWNANTDPSNEGGRLAVLQPGRYLMKVGTHHPASPNAYTCLVQASPFVVLRDNGVKEVGEFYIHLHRGGYSTTGSEGCQTIHPEQWVEAISLILFEMEVEKLKTIPYILTAREDA